MKERSHFRLSRWQRRAISSIAVAALPSQRPCPLDAVVDHVELSVSALPRVVRTALLTGLATYDNGARVMPFALGRAARSLPPAKAARYFESWWHSPIGLMREFAKGVRGLITLAYYEQPEVMAELGYTPDAWIEVVTKRRLTMYHDDIERAAARVFEPDPLPVLGSNVAVKQEEVA